VAAAEPRVLVVTPQPPLLQGGAPGKCAVALLRGLAGHGLEVHAVTARGPGAVAGTPPADLDVEIVDIPPEESGWTARLRRLRRPRGDTCRGVFAERVRQAAARADVVHLEEVDTVWCGEGLGVPVAAHLHYLARRDRALGLPWARQFREVVQFALAERSATRRYRYLVASSPEVAAALRRAAPRGEVVLAPLALDPAEYPAAPLSGPPTAGLIGTGTWAPTRDAFHRLVRDVWPSVRRAVPEARLLLAGRGLPVAEADADAGVEVVGEVESSVDFLHGLSVLLFPLSRGSGMKVKVLESIACGLPVVTTPAGAEGIDRTDGVVEEAANDAFARAAVELLTDAEGRRQRGAAARRLFHERYTPGPATAPLVYLYRRMVESGQRPA
jgi:glycosyltransferase involved in cell wall biosynthesis